MALSEDDVRQLAKLARLQLSDDEVHGIAPQLESILGFVQQLSELDTDDVQPMTTALDVENRWRDDQVQPSLGTDVAVRTAPSSDGEHFLVPPVLGAGGTRK
ncbi:MULTISPECIES: Asp-tRNA(Asn)/Glu-tRNA(Gln) amidotransferase subunit GatC [Crateriforma]|uniref:Aspartyl/glutamyl-tRNA(Asn/Gln) amidotransferase subunit C n=1 Tax=Crateriforma conspicua TaxID=2527996 RepID=A0A5C5Y916_9PLAN|nr:MULTISPECIES: Asp-tRNA(Asn)/Glu-tRNA(Gln) amidotransferase subunit GatC [Crateriforma]TWT71313.1 Glutamyl-tRNA(Gln) amidotransferase subunit C [Crateriforma conspicua]